MKKVYNKNRNVWERIPEVKDLGLNKKALENKTTEENLNILYDLQMLFCEWNNIPKAMDKTVVVKFNGIEEFEKLK
jgi:hypothetical protein